MPFAPESQLCDEDLEWSFNDVLWENVSEEAKDLILKLLEKELAKRSLPIDKIKIGHSYERVMPGPDYIDSIRPIQYIPFLM